MERCGEIKIVCVNMVLKSKIFVEVIKLLLFEGEWFESSLYIDI